MLINQSSDVKTIWKLKKAEVWYSSTTFFNFVVRPAGFESSKGGFR